MRMALAGELDVLELPGLLAATAEGDELAMNDISFHRRHTGRVAELAYSVEGEQLGEVRCDGLVVATPAGSTGYNLANGGPVLAWGVEGYVVSFIAPHTLTARALVVAPGDVLSVTNRSREEDVEMTTDGRMVCVLPREDTIAIRFQPGCALLAQVPGASFYHRLREKFGRLAY
jgi:NAD+ kinase